MSGSGSVRWLANDLRKQMRLHWPWIAGVLVVLAVLLAIVVHLHKNTHIIVTELYTDPVEFGILPQHVGMYSYVGATVLVVAGSLMLLVAASVEVLSSMTRAFMSVLGGFILLLGIDDVFMIHEWVGLRLAWLIQSDNVPKDRQWLESLVFGGYFLVWIAIIVAFRREIKDSAWVLLALTFGGFGLSVGLDLYNVFDFLPKPKTPTQSIIKEVVEDTAKLAGAFFMLAYSLITSRAVIRTGTVSLTPRREAGGI